MGFTIEFWQDSIVQFIGIEFEEKMEVANGIFKTKKAGDNWIDYCEYIEDMIDSYFTLRSILEFQEMLVRKNK